MSNYDDNNLLLLPIKFFEFRKYEGGPVVGIGAEAVIGGNPKRNVYMFTIKNPSSKDFEDAETVLTGWAKRELLKWQKEKEKYLEQF